jgi:ATP-binding cassette subfamily B multidrug efflux pump
MVKKLIPCMGEYKIYAILTPCIMLGEVLMDILIPMVMAKIIDNGINGGEGVPYILDMGLVMVLMAVISLCCGVLGGKFSAKAGMGFAKNLRKILFYKVQDFSFSNTDKFSTSSLVTRLTTDITNVQNALMMLLRMAVRAPFMLIGATIMSVIINPKLSLVFIIVIPVLGTALYFISTKAHSRFVRMLREYDRLNSDVQENLVGIRVVKAYVREKYENDKFIHSADAVRRAQLRAEKIVILNNPIMQFCINACIIAALWFGGNMVIAGDFPIGELSGFLSYIIQILISLMMISMIFIMMVISKASVSRIVEVLDEDIAIKDKDQSKIKVEDGSIEFRNVSFSYAMDKENLTLNDVSFHIDSGQTIGIIGQTGSAKTTLVQLIPRLYDVFEGEVIVGGHNVKEYSLKALRDEVAVVLQKNVLFSGTIKENVKWGKENVTDKEIIDVCKAAQAHDFIMSFPEGYETYLGQGGVNVSGGQKQRLCIARTLLKKPMIVIFDDSTSAVDTTTDSKIRQAVKDKLSHTTTITIAQRISSVMDADRIIVLDNGMINAYGTHDELLKNNEIYREVYQSQQKEVE